MTRRTTKSHFFLFVFLSTGIGIFGSGAFAFPEYTLKEKKDCRYCHVDGNAGPTNARGRYYKEHLSFEGYGQKKRSASKKSKRH